MPENAWKIATPDGDFSAYVARPEGPGPWPFLVVIQEIFGVNAVMRDLCDRYAADLGVLAICPDLFWRIQPGIDITDQSEAEWAQAFSYFKAFDIDKGIADIERTIAVARASLDCSGKIGAVGYCLGGLLAYLTAARTDVDASVGYYAVGLEGRLGEAAAIRRPMMLHMAGRDGFVKPEARNETLRAFEGQPLITCHLYPDRDHAFARPGGAHFDAADAALANQRTADFLRERIF